METAASVDERFVSAVTIWLLTNTGTDIGGKP